MYLLLALAAPFARGQSSDALDRSQLFRTQPGVSAPEGAQEGATGEGYATPTANDADLGTQSILRREERYRPFAVSVGAPFYYTSNVALSSGHEQYDIVFTPGLSVSYLPRIAQNFSFEVGAAEQFFIYDRFGDLDFSSLDLNIGLGYTVPQLHQLSLGIHYDYNRLTSDSGDNLFSNNQLLLTAELPFRLGRAMSLSTGIGVNISLAGNPSGPRRDEYDAHLDYHLQLSRALSIDTVGRVVLKPYEGDRTDVSEILALTANYRFNDWLSLSAISTFGWNQSSVSGFDYTVVNLGATIAMTIRF